MKGLHCKMCEENKICEAEKEITLADDERQECENWTRVMGYFRPVSEFNIGKKSEYAERKCFSEKKTMERLADIRKTHGAAE